MCSAQAISAVVCSHNRLQSLRRAISSLARQTLPSGRFEIIVVDNRSMDGTAVWVNDVADSIPNIRYVFEPVLGLNHARNAGWRAASADLVAFLDDDAVADTHWLEVLLAKFRILDDQVACIGGKVNPLWEAAPPAWLSPTLWSYLSVLDWADHDLVLNDDQYFVGANMAFRKSCLERVGGFHGDLDRKGKNLLSNGEVHVKQLLEDAGYITMYTPDAAVSHSISAARMSKRWFRRRHYWQGVSDFVMERIQSSSQMQPPRARRLLRQLRATATVAADAFRGLPWWILGRDQVGDLAWHYRMGRTMAGWRDVIADRAI